MSIVTKYCSKSDRTHLLKGHLRLGTLSSFRTMEYGDGGLFQDYEEGSQGYAIGGRFENKSLRDNMRDITIKSMTNYSDGNLVEIGGEVDAFIFCTSIGHFDRTLLSSIREGFDGYAPNPEKQAYVEYDLDRLTSAMSRLAAELAYGPLIHGPIEYGQRLHFIDAANEPDAIVDPPSSTIRDAILRKPVLFSHEKEYRHAIQFTDESYSSLFTNALDPSISTEFIKAIHDEGHFFEC